MPYLTNRFLFHISGQHFPACKIIQPVFAIVEYSYQRTMFVDVTNVTIPISVLDKLLPGHNLVQEIKEAARQHHEKNFNNPDDLAGVLTGMPQGKFKK